MILDMIFQLVSMFSILRRFFVYKKIIFAVGFMLPISVIAAELMPLNDSEISGGASCMSPRYLKGS